MDYSTKSTRSNLSASEVLDIRRLHDEDGLNDAQLSRKYSVSRKTIYDIEQRRTWQNVPAPVAVKGFAGYKVYPDGRVFSVAKGKFLTQATRSTGPVVQLKTKAGNRTMVPVRPLVRNSFK